MERRYKMLTKNNKGLNIAYSNKQFIQKFSISAVFRWLYLGWSKRPSAAAQSLIFTSTCWAHHRLSNNPRGGGGGFHGPPFFVPRRGYEFILLLCMPCKSVHMVKSLCLTTEMKPNELHCSRYTNAWPFKLKLHVLTFVSQFVPIFFYLTLNSSQF